MRSEMHIDEASGLVTFTVSGMVTGEGIIQALSEMMEDPRFRRGASILWDFCGADSDPISTSDIERFAAFVEKSREQRGEGYKVAFVVSRDVDFGLGRMYEGYAGQLPFEVRVFRDKTEAKSWINF